jgi:hypothetical protein
LPRLVGDLADEPERPAHDDRHEGEREQVDRRQNDADPQADEGDLAAAFPGALDLA